MHEVAELEQAFSLRLTSDLKEAATELEAHQARFIVDLYYTIQEDRKRTANQVRSSEEEEPNVLIDWMHTNFRALESDIKKAMDSYSDGTIAGQWAKGVYGIGPVIAGGLLAHVDMERATTVSKLWRFAGLDPTVRWEKGEKRPWNAKLKVLCWHAGESFKKFSLREECFYGHLYRERKELEVRRNEAGEFADQAARTLQEKKIREPETRATYEAGKLPAGRLDLRATRYATKRFLSHFHQVAYREHYGVDPEPSWIIATDTEPTHVHNQPVPNWPWEVTE